MPDFSYISAHSLMHKLRDIPRGKQSFDQSGLGVVKPADVKKSDDDFDLYRKRMMLAYRFRPNPLVSPRNYDSND